MKRFSIGRLALGLLLVTACGGEIDGTSTPQPAPSLTDPNAIANVAAEAERAIAASPEWFFADARHTFSRRDVILDPSGAGHVRFDRTFLGMKVIGGDFVVHLDRFGKLSAVSNALAGKFDIDVAAPRIEADAAKTAALASLTDVTGASATSATLVIDAADGPAKLAWEVVVEGARVVPDRGETATEMHVLIDAKAATVIDAWDGIESVATPGTGNGFFVGNVELTTDSVAAGFALRDPSRGNMNTVDLNGAKGGNGTLFVDADNAFGDGTLASRQSGGVDAQFGTAKTWDYYLEVHGRNGIGNDGVGAVNRVHYGKRYNNAYWSDSCFCMTYGDGDGNTFYPFQSLDVAGHEMSHGVTSRTANLAYRGESGGLNEANSDIFGTSVEFYAANALDVPDYDIGEKLYISGTRSLRYMYQPHKDGNSSDCWYSQLGRLDVHYSSGPANHFFYLLSEGSAPNGYAIAGSKTCNATDKQTATGSDVVVGIGRAKAEKIWYRALTTYMTSTTNYAGARANTLSAATDLYPDDVPAVAAAWAAVNVR